ncbi:MAG: type II toxin-antitoxin system RelE/ParE family toxin [Myxococcota bacterium]
MRYAVQLSPRALKQLGKLPRASRVRLCAGIDSLEQGPSPKWRKLANSPCLYRLRVGDYRVVFRVDRHRLLILVARVGHRREIYR